MAKKQGTKPADEQVSEGMEEMVADAAVETVDESPAEAQEDAMPSEEGTVEDPAAEDAPVAEAPVEAQDESEPEKVAPSETVEEKMTREINEQLEKQGDEDAGHVKVTKVEELETPADETEKKEEPKAEKKKKSRFPYGVNEFWNGTSSTW